MTKLNHFKKLGD